MTERSCKTCMYCKARTSKKKTRSVYSCNEAGMMTTDEALLPKHCERWRRKNG